MLQLEDKNIYSRFQVFMFKELDLIYSILLNISALNTVTPCVSPDCHWVRGVQILDLPLDYR
jgi:hypothetical protein